MAVTLQIPKGVRNAIFSVLLIVVAFTAAIGSALLARHSYIMSVTLALTALCLCLLIAILVIPPLARRARVEIFNWQALSQITVTGWLYLAVTAIIGLAALNSANNLLYLIFSILIGLLFASNVIARNTLRDLLVKLRLPDHIFAGEPTLVSVVLENHKRWLPSFSLLIEADTSAELPGAEQEQKKLTISEKPLPIAYFSFLPRGSALRQHTRHSFPRRGWYRFDGFTLATRFPTGFFKRTRQVEAAGELIIYPKPQPISDFFHLLPINDGQFESQARGITGTDLYAIRPYYQSDQMRQVDWKATAKSDRLMVKEVTREDEWRVNLVFDSSQVVDPDFDFAAKFERAITLSASLASHFVQEGAEIQLITPGETIPYGSGQDHLYRILRHLAGLQPGQLEHNSDPARTSWWLYEELPSLTKDRHFKIVITSAERGSIPAALWRTAHVVYLRDL